MLKYAFVNENVTVYVVVDNIERDCEMVLK